MPLDWNDLFFEEKAEQVMNMFELTPDERDRARDEWAEENFVIDKPVYRNGEKAVLDGRNSALSALQHICRRIIVERSGVVDRSRELSPKRVDN